MEELEATTSQQTERKTENKQNKKWMEKQDHNTEI